MAKLSHFWKWQIGRFWYFDVWKAPGEKILAFQGWAKMVSWLQTDWIPHGVNLQKPPSNTPKQLWDPKISPRSIKTPLQTPKNKKDTNRHQQTLPDVFKHSKTTLRHSLKMHDRVRLEPICHFGKTVKGKTFFTWPFGDIKISKPPYLPLPKMIEFCHFSYFSCMSERNYNLQSLWITL